LQGVYPGEPGVGGRAKGQLPGRLERLEELIWLEKGAQGQSVCEAKGEQQSKKRRQRVTIAGREVSWWSTRPARIRVGCGVGGRRHWAIRSVSGEAKGRRTEGREVRWPVSRERWCAGGLAGLGAMQRAAALGEDWAVVVSSAEN
jgi:hypothetical protein